MSDQLEVFQGFEISYPEYTVTLPQTLNDFTVRTLTLSEEETLQNSAITISKLTDHLTHCIWKCIVKKPDEIQSFDDFLNKVTVRDREALLYGLYHITYGDKQTYSIPCPNCNKNSIFNLDMSKLLTVNAYPGDKDEILNSRVTVELDNVKGGKAILKQPTLKHEQNIYNDPLFQIEENLETASEVIIVDYIVQEKDDGTQIEARQSENILKALRSLTTNDHNKILKEYYENFGQYRIELRTNYQCQHCGHQDKTTVDLSEQFFRALWSGPQTE